jgi:hypothetical protein
MEYPLPESIGEPELLVGREKEFSMLDEWISLIPRRLSKSKAILARRKSGKTAIVQRIFNRLWSENGAVMPFYIHIPEKKIWKRPAYMPKAFRKNRYCPGFFPWADLQKRQNSSAKQKGLVLPAKSVWTGKIMR